MVHLYKDAATLSDPDYRQVLGEISGCQSAKHPGLTQWHFDQVMAHLEGLLHYRIQEGIVSPPDRRRISNLFHWRRRLPTGGGLNSRQANRIRELWTDLVPYLPDAERTDNYLTGIAAKATGYRCADVWHLKAWQAGLLIDALRDRLHYAVRRGDAPAAESAPQLQTDLIDP